MSQVFSPTVNLASDMADFVFTPQRNRLHQEIREVPTSTLPEGEGSPKLMDRLALAQIFPGGVLPSVTFLASAMTTGSQGQLVTDSIENIGPRTFTSLLHLSPQQADNVASLAFLYQRLRSHIEGMAHSLLGHVQHAHRSCPQRSLP